MLNVNTSLNRKTLISPESSIICCLWVMLTLCFYAADSSMKLLITWLKKNLVSIFLGAFFSRYKDLTRGWLRPIYKCFLYQQSVVLLYCFALCFPINHTAQNSAFYFSDEPKNTSALVRSSSETGADGSIVLICCSDAQPPVEKYSWFEIVDGQILKVGHQAEMLLVHGGQYLCNVSNK